MPEVVLAGVDIWILLLMVREAVGLARSDVVLARWAGQGTVRVHRRAPGRSCSASRWLTDVLEGTVVRRGWSALCFIGYGGRTLRFGRPVAAAAEITR